MQHTTIWMKDGSVWELTGENTDEQGTGMTEGWWDTPCQQESGPTVVFTNAHLPKGGGAGR